MTKAFNNIKKHFIDDLLEMNEGIGDTKPGQFDCEIAPFLIAINAEPHVFTTQSCIGHFPGEPKYDKDPVGYGVVWIAFDGVIPEDCPLVHDVLYGREDFPILEVKFPRKDYKSLKTLLEWVRSKKD